MKRIALLWWKRLQKASHNLDSSGFNSYLESAGHLPQMMLVISEGPGSRQKTCPGPSVIYSD